jgi:hypothetical protein
VLLAGPRDDALVALVRGLTGARVEQWVADGPPWDHAAVLAALKDVAVAQVLVLSVPEGLQLVPTDRAPTQASGAHADGSGPEAVAQADPPTS